MLAVIFWATAFSIVTTLSILLLGHRDLIAGDMNISRLFKMLFDWRFLLGAGLAFLARILFILTNNALYKIPELSTSSTTITTLINSAAIIMVVIANYYFLDERINTTQIFGAILIFIGIFFVTRV